MQLTAAGIRGSRSEYHLAPADPARDLFLGPAAPTLPAPGQLVFDPRQGRPMSGRQQHFPQRVPSCPNLAKPSWISIFDEDCVCTGKLGREENPVANGRQVRS